MDRYDGPSGMGCRPPSTLTCHAMGMGRSSTRTARAYDNVVGLEDSIHSTNGGSRKWCAAKSFQWLEQVVGDFCMEVNEELPDDHVFAVVCDVSGTGGVSDSVGGLCDIFHDVGVDEGDFG